MSGAGAVARGTIALLLLGLLAIGSCSAPQRYAPRDDDEAKLFAAAYQQVLDYYIDPRTARDAALPALDHLSALAPDVAVKAEGREIVLRSGAEPLARFAAPEAKDTRAWGEVSAAVLQQARARVPAIAATKEERVVQTVFAGLTGSLDRFSRYAGPEAAREQHASRDGFEGIGVTLDTSDSERIRISSIVPGGPAERAGIAVDDRILEIDGLSTAALGRPEVVQRLRGPADSRVDLTIERSGSPRSLAFSVARAYIIVPTVTASLEGDIAIIHVSGFNQRTADSVRESFTRVHKEHRGLRGVVLDLRNNPGGLLDQGVAVADLFMAGGRIAATIGRSVQEFDAGPGDIAGGLPMVVLVNGGSASSAEIVAAALQDSGRAVIVGSSSFGKGTVQTVLPLPNDGEFTITSARLVTPAGYSLHEHGVVPAICTSGAQDDAAAISSLLRRSSERDSRAEPRGRLDEAGWTRLRKSCPGETAERRLDVETAERLLGDQSLYAHLVHPEPLAVAAKPVAVKAD